MEQAAWLAALKPGDEVLCEMTVGKVVKRVPGGGVLVQFPGYKYRFNKHGRCGTTWNWRFLREATPGMLEKARAATRRKILLNKITSVRWNEMPTETLVAIDAELCRLASEQKSPT